MVSIDLPSPASWKPSWPQREEGFSELYLPFPLPPLSSGISFCRGVLEVLPFDESSLLFRVLKKDFLDGGSWQSPASPWDSCSLAIPNALAFLAVGQYIEFNLPSS